MLLSTAYFPPLAWFALAAKDMLLPPTDPSSPLAPQDDNCHSERSEESVVASHVWLEACENYQKQSYRNRCYILAGDGVQMLQVPVIHAPSMGIREVRVDYSTPWVLRSQRALDAAYQTSAYFDYYRDPLFALMDRQPETLWELNLSLMEWCLDKLSIACTLEPTQDFAAPGTVADDYRNVIHPKRPDTIMSDLGLDRPYYQVFRDRMGGFTPNLSILDLLFNEGPDSILSLKRL